MTQSAFEEERVRFVGAEPVVSVLMPAYNVRSFICEAIESIQRQSFDNWELLVVDDGSTDGTFDEARRAAGDDPRVVCLRSPENEGIGLARTRALARAQGRLVALMDSDDVAEKAWLATRIRQLQERPDLAAVSGSRRLIDEEGRPLGRTREALAPEALAWGLLFGDPFCQPSAVLRREAVIRAGGYGRERFLEDWHLFARLSRGGKLIQTDDLLVRYRVRTTSSSWTLGRDRDLLGGTVEEIIRENLVGLGLELELPAGLAWALFRGREPVELSRADTQRAIAVVLEALRLFMGGRSVADRAGLASGVLRDIANVLRCAAWSPWSTLSAIRGVGRSLGIPAFFHPAAVRELAVVLALPLTSAWRERARNKAFERR